MDESGFGGNLPNRFVQLSPSQSVEQIAREEDALSLPAGEPFIGEMFGHRVTDLDPETAASRHSRLAHEKLAIQPRRAWRTDLLLKGEVRPRAFITTRRDGVLPNTFNGADNSIGRDGVRAQLLWTPTPKLHVRLIGAYSDSLSFWSTAIDEARAEGRLGALPRSLTSAAMIAARQPDLDVAIPAAEEGRRLATELKQPHWLAMAEWSPARRKHDG